MWNGRTGKWFARSLGSAKVHAGQNQPSDVACQFAELEKFRTITTGKNRPVADSRLVVARAGWSTEIIGAATAEIDATVSLRLKYCFNAPVICLAQRFKNNMNELATRAMNPKRRFEPGEYAQIGRKYVYALQDPEDQRIFYVGQGTGNRLFEHLDRAEILLQSHKRLTPKFEAIHAVWRMSKDVQLIILAGGLSDREADLVESATLDALNLSSNGELTNAIAAPHSSMVRVEDLAASAYPYVNPGRRYLRVLLLPAQRRQKNKDVYERCRRSWKVVKKHRASGTEEQAAHAVAIVGGVSVGAYRITKWNRLEDGRWEFEGIPYAELEKLNWRAIIKPAMGYWQRGNYLIVEFDGAGRFRIVRGSRKRLWMPCLEQSEATVTPLQGGFPQPDSP